MLIRDLLNEMPHILSGEMPPPQAMRGSYPSSAGLLRENELLGSLTIDDTVFNFWLSRNKTVAKVTTIASNPEVDDGRERQLTCCEVRFYDKVQLPVSDQMQVSRVYTHPEYRDKWLAGAMYIVLARYGQTVVSDTYQYIPGKELWKKLAVESSTRNYRVFVWNQYSSDWTRDVSGVPLHYDSSNLYDSEIWHSENAHKTCLLVLTAQQKIE
jgi:hypothetical protein